MEAVQYGLGYFLLAGHAFPLSVREKKEKDVRMDEGEEMRGKKEVRNDDDK